MSYTIRIEWEQLRSIDSATFTGSFQAIGTPLDHPAYILKLVNNSNRLVTISKDGVTSIDVAPANSFWLYDEGKVGVTSQIPTVSKGTQIYVSGLAGGTGSVYLVVQYIVQK